MHAIPSILHSFSCVCGYVKHATHSIYLRTYQKKKTREERSSKERRDEMNDYKRDLGKRGPYTKKIIAGSGP